MIFVDPAMADHGKLYSGFGPDFPAAMARVVARADVAKPNLTEACLLTGTPYREDMDEPMTRELLQKVAALGAGKVVLTGVSFTPDRLGAMGYDSADGQRGNSGMTAPIHCALSRERWSYTTGTI